jgi:hypothetical protein
LVRTLTASDRNFVAHGGSSLAVSKPQCQKPAARFLELQVKSTKAAVENEFEPYAWQPPKVYIPD